MVVRLLLALLLAVPVAAFAQSPTAKGHVDTSPGISIYYERYGSGPNVVLIPGRFLMPEFAALARPDRSIILYDMRNRGRSGRVEDASRITIMGDVEDVEALRRHFGAEKVSLVGFSYLGLMVPIYATRHPDRVERLVQIGPVPRKFGTPYPADQQAGNDTLSSEAEAAWAEWQKVKEPGSAAPLARCRAFALFLSNMIVVDPANAAKVADPCVYENESIANAERHLSLHFADIQKRDFPKEPFTKLTHPVLTLHGLLDRNAPYGSGVEWAATFPNARLISVDRGAHQLWADDPAVIADIDKFLAGQWPERAQRFGRE
jgi:proline iminopeptidase